MYPICCTALALRGEHFGFLVTCMVLVTCMTREHSPHFHSLLFGKWHFPDPARAEEEDLFQLPAGPLLHILALRVGRARRHGAWTRPRLDLVKLDERGV